MPKLNPRPGTFRATQVAPGAGAPIGRGLEQAGALARQFSAQKSQQAVQDIGIEARNAARMEAVQRRQQDRADQVLTSQIKIDNRVKYNEIQKRISGAATQEDLDTLSDEAQSEIDQITNDSTSQFSSLEGQQRYLVASESARGTARIRIENIRTARGLELIGEGTLGSFKALSGGEYQTQDDVFDAFEEAEDLRAGSILAGLQSSVVDEMHSQSVRTISNEYMFTTLSDNPLAQIDFLDSLESNKETKGTFSASEVRGIKNVIQSEVDSRKRFASSVKTYQTQAASSSVNEIIFRSDNDEIGYSEAVAGIMESNATPEEETLGLQTLAQKNELKHTVFEAQTAEQRRLLDEQGDVANVTLSRMGREIQNIFKGLDDDDVEASTLLEGKYNEFSKVLNDSRQALGKKRYTDHALVMGYGRKEIIKQQFSEEPWNRWLSFGEKARSPFVKLVDSMAGMESTPENAFIISFVKDEINALEGGVRFIAESPEEAQAMLDDMRKRADIRFGTQELGLNTGAATERADVKSSIPQVQSAPVVDKGARARVLADIKSTGMGLEDALEANRDLSTPVPAEAIIEAYTQVEPVEAELPVEDRIEPDAAIVDIDTSGISEKIPEEEIHPAMERAIQRAETKERELRQFETSGESPHDQLVREQREVIKAVAGSFADDIGAVFDSVGEAEAAVKSFVVETLGGAVRGAAGRAKAKLTDIADARKIKRMPVEDLGVEIIKQDGKFVAVPLKKKQENPVIDSVPPPEIVLPALDDRGNPGAALTPESGKKLDTFIKSEEGFRLDVYEDTADEKNLTVGYGHKVLPEDNLRFGDTVTQEQADEWLKADTAEAVDIAERIIPNFENHPEELQHVFISMAFQMGEGGVNTFIEMKNALNESPPNYDRVADEMLDSDWAREQTPERAKRAAAIVRKAGG